MTAINTFGASTVQTKKDLANTRKSIIKAGTEYPVPSYTVGLDKIAVFLNGTRLIGSYKKLEDGVAYYEPGYKYDIGSSIIFRSDIAISDEIFITVLDGTDDSTINDLINLGSIFNTGTNASDFGVVTPKVISKVVDTKRIFLNGADVVSISQDYTENKYNSLPSSKALYDALMQLQENIDQIDPDSNFFKDNTVITLPLLSPSFVEGDGDWEVQNWAITTDNKIAYARNDYANKITIANDVFTTTGYHFLVVNIERLDSGKILVTNNAGETVGQFDTAGIQYLEFVVDNPTIFTLNFIASEVFPDESVLIKEIRLHKVTDRIRDYLIYAVENLVAEGGLASKKDVTVAIEEAVTGITNRFTALINEVGDLAYAHIENRSNPHNVTYVQTGSAPLVHNHKSANITDLDQFVENAVIETITNISGDFNAHITNLNNPHKVTVSQIGAAALVHKHKVSDIADMSNYMATVSDNITDTIRVYVDSVTSGIGNSLRTSITNHITNSNNPHKVTISQIGAAALVHNHKVSDITDIDKYIANVIDDVHVYIDDYVQENNSTAAANLVTHINDNANPHDVTAVQVGAAPVQHEHDIEDVVTLTDALDDLSDKIDICTMSFNSHSSNVENPHNVTIEQINAAPLVHTHKVADITDIQPYFTKINNLESLLNLNVEFTDSHISNTNNPHAVNYSQLGTGDMGTVFLNTGTTDSVVHVPIVRRFYICETSGEIEKCKNNIPSMMETFNNWKKISHSTNMSYPDVITNPGGQIAAPSEILTWEYDEVKDVIRNNTNSLSYIGLISPEKYTQYETEIILNAKTNNDNVIGFIVAFTIDENGKHHTLSILRSPGGYDKWALIYDFGMDNPIVIEEKSEFLKWGNGNYGLTEEEAEYLTTDSSDPDNSGTIGWSAHPNGTRIYVSRKGDTIIVKTTDIGEAGGEFVEDATIVVNLHSQKNLIKFIKACSVGFSAISNPYSTWKVEYFRDPFSNIYDVSREVAIVFDQKTNTWADDTSIDIHKAMCAGSLAYNYLTNKLFFIGENSIEKVAISSVLLKDGGGIDLDEEGKAYVDFSIMPTDRFETMLKSIRVPIYLNENLNIYVATSGSDVLDANRGLSSDKPFKTISAALKYVCSTYNLDDYDCIINVAAGDYGRSSIYLFSYTAVKGSIIITGPDQNNPDLVKIGRIYCKADTHYTIQDLTIKPENYDTFYQAVYCLRGLLDFFNVVFDISTTVVTNGSLHALVAENYGNIRIYATDTVTRKNGITIKVGSVDTASLFLASNGIIQFSADINIVGNCTVSRGTAVVDNNGSIRRIISKFINPGRAPVITCSDTITGYRYNAMLNGSINTIDAGENFFPGTDEGIKTCGGQYF